MVFGTQLWYFQPWGRFLGTQIPNLDPGWAGDLFCPKMGPGKRWFCGRNGPPWGCTGFCKRGMDCMVPRRPLGKAISPQTLPENHFLDLPGFRDRFGGALALHGGSLLSLCGPIGTLFSLFCPWWVGGMAEGRCIRPIGPLAHNGPIWGSTVEVHGGRELAPKTQNPCKTIFW